MADSSSPNDAVFWLPDQFLTDDDLLFDKENTPVLNRKTAGLETAADLKLTEELAYGFPTEFPYEFDSALSSPVESVVCSNETENSAATSSDEEDFLAGLTRRLTHFSTQKLAVPGVTHDKLEKSWGMAGSPESTLSGIRSWSVSSNGSPNGSSLVSSPPATPFGCQDDTWDLISAAAGQVARLKMSNEALNKHNNNNSHGRGLLGPPKSPSPVHVVKNPNFCGFYTSTARTQSVNQYQQYGKQEQVLRVRQQQQVRPPTWVAQQPQPQVQIQNYKLGRNNAAVGCHENTRCGGGGRPLVGLSQSAATAAVWPPLQVQPHNQQPQPQTQHSSPGMRAVFLGGSGAAAAAGSAGVKRECAGTGVFLPRRYNNINNPSDTRKRSGCSTVLLPAKVVQALNLNFEDMSSHSHSHHQPQQRFNTTGFGHNYDALTARRNALLTLQKRSMRADPPAALNHHELHLPQDWTY